MSREHPAVPKALLQLLEARWLSGRTAPTELGQRRFRQLSVYSPFISIYSSLIVATVARV